MFCPSVDVIRHLAVPFTKEVHDNINRSIAQFSPLSPATSQSQQTSPWGYQRKHVALPAVIVLSLKQLKEDSERQVLGLLRPHIK